MSLELELCSVGDPRYQAIRNRHYVPNHGAIGQQVHFLIWYRGELVGIISGGSAVYECGPRDRFFEINNENRHKTLVGIVDNNVFRLEKNIPNLARACFINSASA